MNSETLTACCRRPGPKLQNEWLYHRAFFWCFITFCPPRCLHSSAHSGRYGRKRIVLTSEEITISCIVNVSPWHTKNPLHCFVERLWSVTTIHRVAGNISKCVARWVVVVESHPGHEPDQRHNKAGRCGGQRKLHPTCSKAIQYCFKIYLWRTGCCARQAVQPFLFCRSMLANFRDEKDHATRVGRSSGVG